jgi:hypothetical protein
MKTHHRYLKDTIRGQMWELMIIEEGDLITLHKTHLIKDNYEVIKEVKSVITKKQADSYMKKNQMYHVETFNS